MSACPSCGTSFDPPSTPTDDGRCVGCRFVERVTGHDFDGPAWQQIRDAWADGADVRIVETSTAIATFPGGAVQTIRSTWRDRVEPSAYDRGVGHGAREANFREAYDGAGVDDAETWFTGPDTGPALTTDRERWDYERGFGDGWAQHFETAGAES